MYTDKFKSQKNVLILSEIIEEISTLSKLAKKINFENQQMEVRFYSCLKLIRATCYYYKLILSSNTKINKDSNATYIESSLNYLNDIKNLFNNFQISKDFLDTIKNIETKLNSLED